MSCSSRQDGSTFKAAVIHLPYFYVGTSGDSDAVREVDSWLRRKFQGLVVDVEPVRKLDLSMVLEMMMMMMMMMIVMMMTMITLPHPHPSALVRRVLQREQDVLVLLRRRRVPGPGQLRRH